MPTYDYQCQDCGHKFEEFQSMSAKPLRKCPNCGKLKLKRLIGTGAAVIFKGSGFWQTDYRSESYKKGAEADKKANESTSKSDSSSKSDASAKSKSSQKSQEKKSDAKSKKD